MVTPKKKPVPVNPDCKPATRGFVKWMIRKTEGHNHKHGISSVFTFAYMICGIILSLVLISERIQKSTSDQWLAPVVLTTLLAFVIILDLVFTDDSDTSYPQNRNKGLLEKYQPPYNEDECEY
jgi:hypothetical protein